MKDQYLLTENNILDFILNCATEMDINSLSERGRWIILPGWVCGWLRKYDIFVPVSDLRYRGEPVSIDRFQLFQGDADSNLVTFGTTFALEQIYCVKVKPYVRPADRFDEWNW